MAARFGSVNRDKQARRDNFPASILPRRAFLPP